MYLGGELRQKDAERPCRRLLEVDAGAAGHYGVEKIALSKGRFHHAQQVLLQTRELRKTEREASIIAESAQVTKMIGDAFQLQIQPAQPCGAGRQIQAGHAFQSLAVGPGIRNGAVARHPGSETMTLQNG